MELPRQLNEALLHARFTIESLRPFKRFFMQLSDFEFELPESLIAQQPPENREDARMLLVDRENNGFSDATFREFPARLAKGDVLVLNNTKVFPARLRGKLETGAAIEIFLVEETGQNCWTALAKPGRRLKPGKRVLFGDELSATVEGKFASGQLAIRFESAGSVDTIMEAAGQTPLPPYIHRPDAGFDSDRNRYQTVYAADRGAIAAPTAGLHFTAGVLQQIRDRGVSIVEITLHVGYGTFEPVRARDLAEHTVLPERFKISAEAADELNAAIAAGRRIVAVGTTTTRALETSVARHGKIKAESSFADLTIRPGHAFKAVGALLTNFHLPKSSLLILVSSFGGHKLIMESYRHAVEAKYRFYSYGDCMFIS